MPHIGEVFSLVGTLRRDGAVQRVFNSLVTVALDALRMENTGFLLLESGSHISLES